MKRILIIFILGIMLSGCTFNFYDEVKGIVFDKPEKTVIDNKQSDKK